MLDRQSSGFVFNDIDSLEKAAEFLNNTYLKIKGKKTRSIRR